MCHFCVVIFSSTAGALAGMLSHPHGPASFPSTVGVVEVVASMWSITPVQSSRACRGGIIVRGHLHFFYSLPPPASATCPQGLVLMLHRGPTLPLLTLPTESLLRDCRLWCHSGCVAKPRSSSFLLVSTLNSYTEATRCDGIWHIFRDLRFWDL